MVAAGFPEVYGSIRSPHFVTSATHRAGLLKNVIASLYSLSYPITSRYILLLPKELELV